MHPHPSPLPEGEGAEERVDTDSGSEHGLLSHKKSERREQINVNNIVLPVVTPAAPRRAVPDSPPPSCVIMEVLLTAEELAAGIGRLSAAVRQVVGRRPLTVVGGAHGQHRAGLGPDSQAGRPGSGEHGLGEQLPRHGDRGRRARTAARSAARPHRAGGAARRRHFRHRTDPRGSDAGTAAPRRRLRAFTRPPAEGRTGGSRHPEPRKSREASNDARLQ